MDDDSAAAPGEITRLLRAHRQGDPAALDALMPLVYDYLRVVARRQIARGRPGETLGTTALVHETYVQLQKGVDVDWVDRSHFFAICATTMRRVIVDYLRQRRAQKRGGGVPPLPLKPDLVRVERQADTLLAVDRALHELGGIDERLQRLVELRFFVGMSEVESATALGVTRRTVQRDWVRAKAWLRSALG